MRNRAILLICAAAALALCLFGCVGETAPTGIVLSETEIHMDLKDGGVRLMTASVYPEGCAQTVIWKSGDESVLTVEYGVVTARRAGKATVTATVPGADGVFARCEVTVTDSRAIPTEIRVEAEADTMEPTQRMWLTAVLTPSNANDSIIWKTNNPDAVQVSADGLLTAKSEGAATVYAVSAMDDGVVGHVFITVKYKKTPQKLALSAPREALEIGETMSLTCEIQPADASQAIRYTSTDESVATVDENGRVTAIGFGTCVLRAASEKNRSVRAEVEIRVNDPRVPERIVAYPAPLSLEPGEARKIETVVFPQGLNGSLVWKSSDESVAAVDETGLVTAQKEGNARITASSEYSDKAFVSFPVTVKYGVSIQRITLRQTEIVLDSGDRIRMEYELEPADAGRAITFEPSDPTVARVDEEGNLVALMRGATDITIASHRNPNVSAVVHVVVKDDLCPLSMTAVGAETSVVLAAGERLNADIVVEPASADTRYHWTTDKESIAAIGSDGIPVAVGRGVATVSAVSDYNPNLRVDFRVTVEGDGYTLVMPERRTGEDKIEENLRKIDNVRLSAQACLKREYEEEDMPENEYVKRSQIIDDAFEMYHFAWMVESVQRYWRDENSEDGAKDFKPGTVYYGLPYTSGGNYNHLFNFQRALDAGRYVKAEGKSYYLLNQSGDFRYNYVGNDCSAFVALALFGYTMFDGEMVKTDTLYDDYRLIPMEDASQLRAGDILVRHSSHVIMFLYWADEAHTQAVFIEQGGSEPGINTLSTSVYNLDDYLNNYYRMRRLRSFD